MGHYNKKILESVSCTSDHEVSIDDVEDYKNFTIEIGITGLTGGTADTTLDILTSEDKGSYNTITGTAITFGATFTGTGIIRVVDLTTKNCKIKYSFGAASGGTIDYVTVTFAQ